MPFLNSCLKISNPSSRLFSRFLFLGFIALVASSCATNTLTGKRELSFYSTGQQITMGSQQYVPSQQSQGGQYSIDAELTRYVQRVGQKLVDVIPQVAPTAERLPYEFVVLNNSVPNAWALPGGKLAINRGLLMQLSDEAELASVLGHEIVHALASQQRVDTNRALAQQLPSGTANRQQYVNATRDLKKHSKAYELEQQAKEALAKNQPQQALNLLDEAIRIEPRQDQFWILRSDAWAHKNMNQPNKAIQSLNTAIKKNDNYFLSWLKRGYIKTVGKQYSNAEYDLKRSQSLLPTPAASQALAHIATQRQGASQ